MHTSTHADAYVHTCIYADIRANSHTVWWMYTHKHAYVQTYRQTEWPRKSNIAFLVGFTDVKSHATHINESIQNFVS